MAAWAFLWLQRARRLPSCGAQASPGSGFSCCGARALGHSGFSGCGMWAQELWLMGSAALQPGV